MKNFLSSLSPVHEEVEEQEPVLVENQESPYLPEPPKTAPHKGPDKTIIAEDVVITGPITASGNMEIYGTVYGEVSTEGSLLLAGTVEGNVKARELHFSNATLTGDIIASGLVVLEDSSNINGNIITRDFILDSKLQGNVKAEGSVMFKKMAVLSGDVEAAAIEVSKGATINGSVKIKG